MNYNNRNNSGLVRACREVSARECQGVELRDLYTAYKSARAGKKPSNDQLQLDSGWMERLLQLQADLNAGTWEPSRTICSIATAPKAREIHAPACADRVMHHWLVPKLEEVWEPKFIFDSFSNRPGKGTHAAVERLTGFVRQVDSGEGGGYFLQLDVWNFFNSIHRPTLWTQLKRGMEGAGVSWEAQRATHALLRRSPLRQGVVFRGTAAELALVPPHKRLVNAAPDCGLPIGNLSSQFFANVYLHDLDLFVKHVLGAKRYLRYVDDFVLAHHDRAVLQGWQEQIEAFLRDRLRLRLKDEIKLRPLSEGIDFLGYVIRPTHTTVRRRVVSHAREKLSLWEQQHIAGGHAKATPEQYRHVRAVWASYGLGHFSHANSRRLTQDFHRRYPWLHQLAEVPRRFHHNLEGKTVTIQIKERA